MENTGKQEEKQEGQITEERTQKNQLWQYATDTFGALFVFGLFVLASWATSWIGNRAPDSVIGIMFKVVAWLISAMGAYCCVLHVYHHTVTFTHGMKQKPPPQTSEQPEASPEEITGEVKGGSE